MKKRREKFFIVLGIIMTVIGVFAGLLFLSPWFISMIIRKAFENPKNVQMPKYENAINKITVFKNLTYNSIEKNNYLDIYLPKKEGPHPVIIWIHGGAFVGGDKDDITYYATDLAYEGYAVVNINYARAPEAKYPTPAMQVSEVYTWLKTVEKDYSLDLTRIAIAGDSAGAHIGSQFVIAQTSLEYSERTGIPQVIPAEDLKCILLYCGPYDTTELSKLDNKNLNYFMEQVEWAYIGSKNGLAEKSEEVNILLNVDESFPPAFITDSNTLSFQSHGIKLSELLKDKNVPVETYFIPIEEEETAHEYQFKMDTPAGITAFEKTLDFLEKFL